MTQALAMKPSSTSLALVLWTTKGTYLFSYRVFVKIVRIYLFCGSPQNGMYQTPIC